MLWGVQDAAWIALSAPPGSSPNAVRGQFPVPLKSEESRTTRQRGCAGKKSCMTWESETVYPILSWPGHSGFLTTEINSAEKDKYQVITHGMTVITGRWEARQILKVLGVVTLDLAISTKQKVRKGLKEKKAGFCPQTSTFPLTLSRKNKLEVTQA